MEATPESAHMDSMEALQRCLDLKQQASDAFETNDLLHAVDLLTAAIRQCPEQEAHLRATLHCNRSACHAEGAAYLQALVDGRVAMRIRPAWARPYLRQVHLRPEPTPASYTLSPTPTPYTYALCPTPP